MLLGRDALPEELLVTSAATGQGQGWGHRCGPRTDRKKEDQVGQQAFISIFVEMGNQECLIAMMQHLNITHRDEFEFPV